MQLSGMQKNGKKKKKRTEIKMGRKIIIFLNELGQQGHISKGNQQKKEKMTKKKNKINAEKGQNLNTNRNNPVNILAYLKKNKHKNKKN